MQINFRKLLRSSKAFQIGDMVNIGVTIAVTAIVLAISASIVSNVQGGQAVNSTAYNATGYGLTGINTFSSYIPTVALVAVAAVIIGIIFAFFLKRRSD